MYIDPNVNYPHITCTLMSPSQIWAKEARIIHGKIRALLQTSHLPVLPTGPPTAPSSSRGATLCSLSPSASSPPPASLLCFLISQSLGISGRTKHHFLNSVCVNLHMIGSVGPLPAESFGDLGSSVGSGRWAPDAGGPGAARPAPCSSATAAHAPQ